MKEVVSTVVIGHCQTQRVNTERVYTFRSVSESNIYLGLSGVERIVDDKHRKSQHSCVDSRDFRQNGTHDEHSKA